MQAFLTALLGVSAFAAGLKGWFLVPLGPWLRLICLTAGFCMIKPGIVTDIAGFFLFIICAVRIYLKKKRLHIDKPR